MRKRAIEQRGCGFLGIGTGEEARKDPADSCDVKKKCLDRLTQGRAFAWACLLRPRTVSTFFFLVPVPSARYIELGI